MRTALDTNVISCLWSGESTSAQVMEQLALARREGGLVVSGPVYAELLAHPRISAAEVNDFLLQTNIEVDFDLGEEVWRLAAHGFAAYAKRRRDSAGGQPRRLLVDFLIGAHACLAADRLLTLDKSRYSRDFPKLRLM